MFKYYIWILLIVQVTISQKVFCQLEAKNWYFNSKSAIRFEKTGLVQLYDSKMSGASSACISDKNGNLLMYGGQDIKIYPTGILFNIKHDTLINCKGFYQSGSSYQTPLIIPFPGHPNLYYLFTLLSPVYSSQQGFWYHIVDMSKDNGKGEMIIKNQKICGNVTEQISATFHADKKSVWIMVREWNSNKWKAYLLKSSGLDTVPIISSTGTIITGSNQNCVGQMKFSASGEKIACVISGDKLVDVCDFDNKTGKVSNSTTLNFNNGMTSFCFGAEFSSNGKFLYTTTNSLPGRVYQFDITSGIDSIIKNSVYIVFSNTSANPKDGPTLYYNLQIGIDKKIYVARGGPIKYIACINNPDEKGNSCNYIEKAFNLIAGVNSTPNFLQSYFYLPDIEIKNTCLSDSTAFNLKDTSNIDSIYWRFGDSSYSWQFYTKHVYADTGFYMTKAVIFYDNTSDTFEREIRISNYAYPNFGIADNSQCLKDNSFQFYDSSYAVDGSMTYQWDFGDSSGSFQQNPAKSYLVADTFHVKLTVTSSYGCETSKTKELYVHSMPKVAFSINDSIQCLNENNFILYNPADSLNPTNIKTWDFGDGTKLFQDTVNHSYTTADTFKLTLIEETALGCKDTASGIIVVLPSPVAAFRINDSTQCFNGQNFVMTDLSKITGDSISTNIWIIGNDTIRNQKSVIRNNFQPAIWNLQLVTSSSNNCTDTITKSITVFPSPKTDFSINDPNQCFKQQQFLMNDLSTITGDSIVKNIWIIGNDTIRNQKSAIRNNLQPATWNLKLVTSTENTCSDSIEKQLIVFSNPVNSYSLYNTVQCFNGNLFNFNNLSTSSDGQKVSTFWDLEETTSSLKNFNYSFKTVGTKNITLISKTDSGCYDTSAFQITVFPSPKADFSINDSDQCFNDQNFEITNKSAVGSGQLANTWHINNDTFSTIDLLINDLQPETCNLKLVTTTENACSDSIEKQLIVHPSPFAQFAVNDSTQCLDSNNFIFTNTSSIGSGAMTYNWIIDSLTFPTFEPSNLQLNFWGKYPVKLIATSDKSCTDTTESSVYVFPNPVSAFIFLNNCHEDTMWFFDKSYSDSGSIQQWYWDFRNGKTSTLKNPFTVFYDTGQKAVTLVSTNDFGCSHDTTRFFKIETHVTAPELERATVENDEFVLIEWNPPKDGIPMTYHLEKSTDSIVWKLLSDFDNKIFNYNDIQTIVDLRNYYYRLNVTDSCQFTSPYSNIGKTILLTIDTSQQFPVLIWTPYELWASGVAGYELQVTGCELQVSGSNDFQTVIEIPKSAIINPQSSISQSDSLTKLSSPTYCYRVLATRNGDGLQSVSNVVCTPTPFRLFIPNAFTPNNDGVNDIFLPMGMYILDYNLQIFSRWGELIFESNDINQGWDGTYKGRICQMDEYFYQISANGTGSQRKTVVGTLMLLR